MATYTSGSLGISGIGYSNVDFEDLIDKLYAIESTKAQKLLTWREDWQTRIDAFAQVRTALVSMQTALKTINSTDKFLSKTAASSNSSIVSASVSSGALAGTYSVEVGQLAASSVWSIGTGLAARDSLVNSSGQDGVFTYTCKGESRTLKVPSGTTLESLKNIINNDSENLGVRVQLVQSGDEMVFQISGVDTGLSATLSIDDATNLTGFSLPRSPLWQYQGGSTNQLSSDWLTYASPSTTVNSTGTDQSFIFTVNGTDYTVMLEAGGTLNDLISAVNAKTAESGVTAQLAQFTDPVTSAQSYGLYLDTANSQDLVTVGGGTLEGYFSMVEVDTSAWHIQQGRNAKLRVNGWPDAGWLEKSSNTVTDVVDGLVLNLRDEGRVTVMVELDTEGIEASVQNFVDAVNNFRTVILNLTKVDEAKTVLDPEYAETQSEMEMGSALTGNYGIQLLSSNLKQAISSQAKGFAYLQEVENKTYGDIFSSLAQIGVITDAETSSPTFGLLVINTESKDSSGNTVMQSTATMTLKEALAKDPEAVAKLFAAQNEGKSNSSHFGLNSFVATITKPGTYDVSYTTDVGGNIISASINGKAAVIDMENRQISLFNHDGADDAAGIILDIYDLTPNSTMEGTVGIRQGKINEILGMLEGTDGILGSNGTLAILENNYGEIVKNIESKIQKEDERLTKWLRLTKLRFSRLEAVLASYQNIQASVESQIAQLDKDS
ncbi:MAG: flagellar filament capping protein FliD [Deltaproteobacteria bacterium]|jgi:flagellar hook-associated protein 2|nr:flagellar filament capping protein FliD [Deltaproteobacteria bacterium]